MSKVTVVICDLHDEGANVPAATIPWSVAGHPFDADLCDEHRAELERAVEALERFAGVSTSTARQRTRQRAAQPRAGATPRTLPSAEEREENARIRQWARTNGIDLGDRGRIGNEIRARYRQAVHGSTVAGALSTP